jgi:hypothetical protein
MPPIPDSAVFQERLAALPVATYQAGETVFAAGSRTGRLLADATTFLAQDPIAALYVATVLARRLDGANQVFIQLKSQLEAGRPRSVVAKTVEKLEGLLGVSDTSLVHADRDW